MARIELTRNRVLKSLLKSRYPQLLICAVLLAAYLFAILAGLIGTPVGSQNFSIVFVWIAWWAILILAAVPFLGRSWCAVCPIPLAGEWLQRGALLEPPSQPPSFLGLRVPARLRNMWMQNLSFTLVALFSSVILTTPSVTAVVLAGMLFAAVGLSMVFERRVFCRYLCPVGGFIGLYAQAAPLELRIQDKTRCTRCADKPCYNGSAAGYGCPWDVFPGGLNKNNYCGLCLECLRTCPKDNIAINLRPFAADLAQPASRLDEAGKAFIMLGSCLVYAAVLLGPWGAFKDAAFQVGTPAWTGYAGAFLGVIFGLLPSLFALAVWAGGGASKARFKQRFTQLAAALVPLGLMFWVAFSLAFVLANASYILAALSDPLGLGWNLFGLAGMAWQPVLSSSLPALQTLALVSGLAWAARTAQRAPLKLGASALPVILYLLAATLLMLWLLI